MFLFGWGSIGWGCDGENPYISWQICEDEIPILMDNRHFIGRPMAALVWV